jgi:hypothetical protein
MRCPQCRGPWTVDLDLMRGMSGHGHGLRDKKRVWAGGCSGVRAALLGSGRIGSVQNIESVDFWAVLDLKRGGGRFVLYIHVLDLP